MQKYDNTFIKCICLSVKMYLWLKWYTVSFFVSGQTYKISKGSNNYCSHCIVKCWNYYQKNYHKNVKSRMPIYWIPMYAKYIFFMWWLLHPTAGWLLQPYWSWVDLRRSSINPHASVLVQHKGGGRAKLSFIRCVSVSPDQKKKDMARRIQYSLREEKWRHKTENVIHRRRAGQGGHCTLTSMTEKQQHHHQQQQQQGFGTTSP